MPTGLKQDKDALHISNFVVDLKGKVTGPFREVSVVSAESEVVERYDNLAGHTVYSTQPGKLKVGRITLKRVMNQSADAQKAWLWRKQVLDAADKDTSYMVDGTISILSDDRKTELISLNVFGVWPSKVTNPSLNTTANELAIEEIELVCERIQRVK